MDAVWCCTPSNTKGPFGLWVLDLDLGLMVKVVVANTVLVGLSIECLSGLAMRLIYVECLVRVRSRLWLYVLHCAVDATHESHRECVDLSHTLSLSVSDALWSNLYKSEKSDNTLIEDGGRGYARESTGNGKSQKNVMKCLCNVVASKNDACAQRLADRIEFNVRLTTCVVMLMATTGVVFVSDDSVFCSMVSECALSDLSKCMLELRMLTCGAYDKYWHTFAEGVSARCLSREGLFALSSDCGSVDSCDVLSEFVVAKMMESDYIA
ncbi:hypothetical protein Tco_0507885 [Tanacetum coccineum]